MGYPGHFPEGRIHRFVKQGCSARAFVQLYPDTVFLSGIRAALLGYSLAQLHPDAVLHSLLYRLLEDSRQPYLHPGVA